MSLDGGLPLSGLLVFLSALILALTVITDGFWGLTELDLVALGLLAFVLAHVAPAGLNRPG